MTKPKTARLSAETRIAGILTAARAELAQNGHENFSPSDVAARCQVSEATIYKYFPTRRDLLLRAAESWFQDMMAAAPDISKQGDIFERLLELIRYSLSVIRGEPALTRYVLLELRSDAAYRKTRFYQLNRQFTSGIRAVIAEALAAGVFRKELPSRLIRNMIFGGIEHQTWAYLRGQGDFSIDETAAQIAELVYRGASRDTRPASRQIATALQEAEASTARLQADAAALQARMRALVLSFQK